MLIFVAGLMLTVPGCTDLPRTLSGWDQRGAGLDTRHATLITARDGRAETQVTIRKAGTFGIAADQSGWIDVARGSGRPLRTASFGAAVPCAKIAKIVYYELQPGTYRVTLRKLQQPQVKLMLVFGDRRRGFARRTRVG
ncbi:hypothetical protein [Sphingomonas sp. R1]|uniref:hypothetical protein n=1 Tax=Sphingomonas sp. R1 TaxID=399176 RepID=UPI0022241E48|nr:hypothetical protein [Sphingomonas sp. R1]UYY76586.1 hypothetical protein OIM94_13825 [Sphingomonas sp. R1]